MMSAGIGGRLNVIGNSMAMVTSGPMPGSTPIAVPTNTPMKQYIRFLSDSATVNPRMRLSKMSISEPLYQRIGQPEPVDEDADRKRAHEDRKDQDLDELELVAAERGDEKHHHERRNQAQALHHEAERHERNSNKRERLPPPFARRFFGRENAANQDEQAECHEDEGQHPREVAGPHAHRGSERVAER